MNTVDIDCLMTYEVKQKSEFIFQIQAAAHPWQRIKTETIHVEGGTPEFFVDATGDNRLFRFSSLADHCEVHYQATIEITMPARDPQAPEINVAQLPADALPYLRPSRYCESDLLSHMAQRTFGHLPRGFSRIEAICEWIRQNIDYEIGISGPLTTARDVLWQRAGVCRDFAHLGIAMCRALNIPARFVVGYVEFEDPPADFHAIFEAYVGGAWVLFDPTQMAPLDKLVRIGTGSDAKDVAFATIYGDVKMLSLNPLVRDHIDGPAKDFPHAHDFIGSKKPIPK